MLKIGLTGGIGSGKTIISNIFKTLAIPVYNADDRAKILMISNELLLNKLKIEFGENIIVNGELDRKKLASIVFTSKDKIKRINAIVHPFVKDDFEIWANLHLSYKYIIQEAAILIESGHYKNIDKIICVYAPEELRINRIINRDKITREEIIFRIKNQMDDEEKKKMADFVIYNDDKQLVLPQILSIHNQLIK